MPEQNVSTGESDAQADLSQVEFDHDVEVTGDAALAKRGREFTLTIAQDEKRFHVHSEIPSITRALLQHPGFVAETGRVNEEGKLTRVRGRLNMGYMKIRPSRRTSTNFHSTIINHERANASEFDDAFGSA